MSYRIVHCRWESGERYVMLLEAETGMPSWYPTLFTTTQQRNAGKFVATMEAALGSIQLLLEHTEAKGIDLEERVLKREFLNTNEVDTLCDEAQRRRQTNRGKTKTVSVGQRNRSSARIQASVDSRCASDGLDEKRGWLVLKPNQPRYIRLLHEDVPIVRAGPIANGEHVLGQSRIIDTMPAKVGERLDRKPDFWIEVDDESMCNTGLAVGDLVAAVHATESEGTPDSGAIVVTRSRDEITIRRLRRIDEQRIRLQPETTNASQSGQIVDVERDEERIEGVMVGALISASKPTMDSEETENAGGI